MPMLSILWRYKELIIIALLLASTALYKHRYDAVNDEYKQYKLTQKVLYDKAIADSKEITKNSKQSIADTIADNKKQLADAGLDRKREANKLKGSINEISNTLAIANSSIQLRNDSTSANTLCKISEDSSGASETERNSNEQLKTVVDACKVTDYDYEALYNAWDKVCLIHGCE